METCKGLGDWLACVRCPNICTKTCPIEGENVVEELKKRIRMLERTAEQSNIYLDGYTGSQRE